MHSCTGAHDASGDHPVTAPARLARPAVIPAVSWHMPPHSSRGRGPSCLSPPPARNREQPRCNSSSTAQLRSPAFWHPHEIAGTAGNPRVEFHPFAGVTVQSPRPVRQPLIVEWQLSGARNIHSLGWPPTLPFLPPVQDSPQCPAPWTLDHSTIDKTGFVDILYILLLSLCRPTIRRLVPPTLQYDTLPRYRTVLYPPKDI